MNAVITNFVAALSTLGGELELLQAITRQVKDLTGFNRVLLYQFDQAGHGTVLAEENDGALPSYLHLRFPASDIPRQARELYVLNTVRIIPDATYVPSPLRGVAQRPMGSLDLSMSVLRSVSPIHLEYMRNMGTRFEIVVRDDGAGMSKEVQRQLFQPFFSTKGDLGNGLGLYISNEIVERHGGRLLVESRLGRGTAMRIHLPANRVQISSQAEAIDPDMKQ
jgi:light-regulated signal transduction histidine kinase (bacteriophytochrome)